MTAAPSKRMTFAEYVALEHASEVRHELDDGIAYAMAGGTPEHAALILAVGHALYGQLTGPCRPFSEALRVRTPDKKVFYPDLVVVCGELARDPEDDSTVTNPTLVLEVLSETTEAYDRGKKFASYRAIPSLTEYVLVTSQGAPLVERFVKISGVWTIAEPRGRGQIAELTSVPARLDVDAIYRDLVGEDGLVRRL